MLFSVDSLGRKTVSAFRGRSVLLKNLDLHGWMMSLPSLTLVPHAVILVIAGIILLKIHTVPVRFDQIHIAGQPMDLNLVDAGQQLGCGYRIFRAAEAERSSVSYLFALS